jgi:hypothetical protein
MKRKQQASPTYAAACVAAVAFRFLRHQTKPPPANPAPNNAPAYNRREPVASERVTATIVKIAEPKRLPGSVLI